MMSAWLIMGGILILLPTFVWGMIRADDLSKTFTAPFVVMILAWVLIIVGIFTA